MFKSKKKKKSAGIRRSLITKENPKSPVSEQYRTIRTNIEFSMVDQQLKTLICTSASPGEGKSTTLSNLAVTFAQQGKRILYVDADLRKPTGHYAFQLENQFGLTSVLTKKKTLQEAIASTDIENLSVLTSGPIPPNPSEILGSQTMAELITEMTDSFDMVLFDAPPVGVVTDAQVLGRLCDGAILVARSKQTEKEALVKAKELLTQVNVNIIGVVLNYRDENDASYYSYYYYGRGE